jgi:hypothetical protein
MFQVSPKMAVVKITEPVTTAKQVDKIWHTILILSDNSHISLASVQQEGV